MCARSLLMAVGFLVSTGCAASSLPRDVRSAVEQYGCVEVPDFFDRPGMVEPPYVYGFAVGKQKDSFAFWCRVEPTGKFRLYAIAKSASLGCDALIVESDNYPGGLSVVPAGKMTLNDFKDVATGKKGPASVPKAPVLKSAYDGAEDYFYCHEGRWFRQFRH